MGDKRTSAVTFSQNRWGLTRSVPLRNKNRPRSRSRSRSRRRSWIHRPLATFGHGPTTNATTTEGASDIENAARMLAQNKPPSPIVEEPTTQNQNEEEAQPHSPKTYPKTPFNAEVKNSDEDKKVQIVRKPHQLQFMVQLAQGSSTVMVEAADDVKGNYKNIADALNIDVNSIICITRNSHKLVPDAIFQGNINQGDLLFVHQVGGPIEVEIEKKEGIIGLTITDGGCGNSFIKRFHQGSIAQGLAPPLAVGQMIESVAGKSTIGLRHFQVAKILRDVPHNTTFVLRLRNPLQSGFSLLAPRGTKRNPTADETTSAVGMGTVRYKSDGQAVVEDKLMDRTMINKLNEVIDSYLGLQDDQLAAELWEKMETCTGYDQLKRIVTESSLACFEFPDELLFDIWGLFTDWKKASVSVSASATSLPRATPLLRLPFTPSHF